MSDEPRLTNLVLVTKKGKDQGFEYRVATVVKSSLLSTRVQDYSSRDNPRENGEWLLSTFGASWVHSDKEEAVQEVQRRRRTMRCDEALHFVDLADIHFPAPKRTPARVAMACKKNFDWDYDVDDDDDDDDKDSLVP